MDKFVDDNKLTQFAGEMEQFIVEGQTTTSRE